MAIDCSAVVETITFAVPETDPSCAVITAEPADCPVAVPEVVIETTLLSELLQVTALVRFWVDPSL